MIFTKISGIFPLAFAGLGYAYGIYSIKSLKGKGILRVFLVALCGAATMVMIWLFLNNFK